MSRPRSTPDSLRNALRTLAETDALEVVAEARAHARARAAKLLENELFEELLAAVARLRVREASADASPLSFAPSEPAHRSDAVGLGEASDPAEPAWWTYCVLSAEDAVNVPAHLDGIESGSGVDSVREGGLAALVSPVPAHEYDDVALRKNLEDLEWVERTARRHEAVLEQTLSHATIVPLRLCTLYRSVEGVRQLLREHAEPLADSLAKVDGCAEWGVKVFAQPVQAGDEPADPDLEPAGETPGASYLIQRRRERERAETAAELRARCAELVHKRISACARESISNPPQRRELHGRNMTMVLNGAYLVAADAANELRDAVRELEQEWSPRGFAVELTGPWPAYNFVSAATGVMR